MNYHYTWAFGRHFDFIVGWLHRVNFFYFYFYVPLITILAICLFLWVFARVRRTNYLADQSRLSRFFWYGIYFSFIWIAVGGFFVAVKMMIVEELDYQERKWFEPYLSPGHFYISSVCFAYLAFILKQKLSYYDLILAFYIQVGLLIGFGVASYRVLHEDIEGATGGVILLIFLAACNYDLIRRVRRNFPAGIPGRRKVTA